MVGCVTEVLQDQIDGGGDTLWHRLAKFHPAVDHNAPIPEVQDLQVLKVTQVRLQIGHKLGKYLKMYSLMLQTRGSDTTVGIRVTTSTVNVRSLPAPGNVAPKLCILGSSC